MALLQMRINVPHLSLGCRQEVFTVKILPHWVRKVLETYSRAQPHPKSGNFRHYPFVCRAEPPDLKQPEKKSFFFPGVQTRFRSIWKVYPKVK
jgi:hypothetical protein